LARSKTPSFITELPLVVDSKQDAELLSRFQAGRQLYNACLNEAMVRMNLLRDSDAYKAAKKIPSDNPKERQKAFGDARKQHRYSDYDLQAYANLVSKRSTWISEKLDTHTQQTLATVPKRNATLRAFKASERVLFGRAKKVRYKVPTRFRSVEGKTNKQGIRWKDNQLIWGKLELTPIIDWDNPVILHGLSAVVKYVRILWRELNGKRRWYVQLVTEGVPYQKEKNYVGDGVVGLDLNISNIAFVSDSQAGLLPFAEGVPTFEREIKALQRQMSRSRRTNNPDNYESDSEGKRGRKTITKKGKCKKGKSKWNNSKNYQRVARKKRELERRKSAYSKSQNRKVVNEILRHGKQIKTENVSVKGWQKRYGKAISAKSPGFVQSELKRKAEKKKRSTSAPLHTRRGVRGVGAGGSFTKFSTQKTALSQTHLNGERIKKKLSERVHHDVTGIVMHRDLFSAYLSRHINDDKLSLQDAALQYPGTEPFLVEAWKRYQETAKRVGDAESRQSHSPSERFSKKLRKRRQIADRKRSGPKAAPNS